MGVFLEGAVGSGFDPGSIGLVVALLLAGLVFHAMELFILPGFGVAGIIGILFLVGGTVAAWMLLGPTWGWLAITATIVLSIALSIVAFRSRAVRKRLVLDTQLERGGGTASADLVNLIGVVGETRSDLRPAGIALLDDRRLDVVSEGGFIEKGTKVKVVDVEGPRIIVAKDNQS